MAFRIAATLFVLVGAIWVNAQDHWIEYEGNEINCSLLDEAATTFEGKPLLRADGSDVTIRDLWQQMLTACKDAYQNVAEPLANETTFTLLKALWKIPSHSVNYGEAKMVFT